MTGTELQSALQLANTTQRPEDGPVYIGLDLVLPKSGNGIHWHAGSTYGYVSYLAWDPQRKIGVVDMAGGGVFRRSKTKTGSYSSI